MIIGIYLSGLALILLGMTGILLLTRMRQMQATQNLRAASQVDISRYAPMQRLLSDEDLSLVAADKALVRQLRAQRCHVARGYLRCMTKDFAALHASIRQIMLNSNEDSPELTALLLRSKFNFVISSCRIEAKLWLYRAGVGTVDLSGLVQQISAFGKLAQMPEFSAA